MRTTLVRRLVPLAVPAMLLAACGGADGAGAETARSATTSTTQSTTTTITTVPPTTTTVDPARLPDPVEMEQLVRDYCSAWPDVTRFLAEDIEFADVSADGWVPSGTPGEAGFVKETDEAVVRGRGEVDAALVAMGFSTIDCGGPLVVSADWIAVPVSASRPDGTGEKGIWVLRIVDDGIGWHLAYGEEVVEASAAATAPDPEIVAEAVAFCALFERSGYNRDAEAVLDAMSVDPAIHAIPHNLHYLGVSGVRTDVSWIFPSDDITCGDITTNGRWSAGESTLTEPGTDLALFGFAVHHHVDGKIHRQYNQYTQTSGTGNWGLPLEDA